MSKFRNLKNNAIYTLEAIVTDATNARDGNRVAIYKDALGTIYVRDLEEFEKKFVFIGESKWPNYNPFVRYTK